MWNGGRGIRNLGIENRNRNKYPNAWGRPDEQSLRLTLIELVSDTLNILRVPDRKKVKHNRRETRKEKRRKPMRLSKHSEKRVNKEGLSLKAT